MGPVYNEVDFVDTETMCFIFPSQDNIKKGQQCLGKSIQVGDQTLKMSVELVERYSRQLK